MQRRLSIQLLLKCGFCLLWLMSVPVQAQSIFKVLVTVDWEGYSLEAENIAQMQSFRQQHPNIPMVQLLNPAYFVREQVNHSQVQQVIQSTLLPNDVQGLHLHAWKSLLNHCHVPFKQRPSFAPESEQCKPNKDCGYTVSLELAYSKKDISRLLACSQRVMVANGFDKPIYFRAGGWQGGPKLMAALIENEFIWDSSTIAAELLTTRWHANSPLIQTLTKLHPEATSLDQPYSIDAQLMEYPNNAALADYTTTDQIIALFKDLLDHEREVMVLGFHQETAVDYLPRLDAAISKMQAIANTRGVDLQWVTQ